MVVLAISAVTGSSFFVYLPFWSMINYHQSMLDEFGRSPFGFSRSGQVFKRILNIFP